MKNKLSLLDICLKCKNRCCIEPGAPIVLKRELPKIQGFLEKENIKNYIIQVTGENYFTIPRNEKGCPYLKKGRCLIQVVKPLDCEIYPIIPTKDLILGFSTKCPAKHLLKKEFFKKATVLFKKLNLEEQNSFLEFINKEGYNGTIKPTDYGFHLILDLFGCERNILESKEKLEEYCNELTKLIKMKPFGKTIIPDKFGKGILYKGYSFIQFIESSSMVGHIAEKMCEIHMDIFSCKNFDQKLTESFTKDFFKAEKIRSRLIKR